MNWVRAAAPRGDQRSSWTGAWGRSASVPASSHSIRAGERPVLGVIQVTMPRAGQRIPQLTEDEVAQIGSTWTHQGEVNECRAVESGRDVCGICLSEFCSGEELTSLPCASSGGCLSVWHTGCIRKWLCQGHLPSCPLCRASFNLDGTPAPIEPPIEEIGSMTFALEFRTLQSGSEDSPFSIGVLRSGHALPADLLHELIFLSLPSRAALGDAIDDSDLDSTGSVRENSGADIDEASQVFPSLRSREISVTRMRQSHLASMPEPVAAGRNATASWPSYPAMASEGEDARARIPPSPSGIRTLAGTSFMLPRAPRGPRGGNYVGAPAILRGNSGGPRGPRGGAGPVSQPRFPSFMEPRTRSPALASRPVRRTFWPSTLGRPQPGVRPPPVTHMPSGMAPGRRLSPPNMEGAEAEEDLDEHWGASLHAGSETLLAMPMPRGARSAGGFTASGGYSSSSTVRGPHHRAGAVVGPPTPARAHSSWSARLASEWPLSRVWNAMPRSRP